MSNADIKQAVDQSLLVLQQTCQGIVRIGLLAYPSLVDPCAPILLLALVVGLACFLLGYLTFLVLVHQEEVAKAKVMQYEARVEAETNGLHSQDPAALQKSTAAVEERKQLQATPLQPVEYEGAETSEQRTPPQLTTAPPTPAPGTPLATSQAPGKAASDSEEGQSSKLATLKSALNVGLEQRPTFLE